MNTFRSRHSETGFTLMELMVSILVLGFILVSFAGLFVMFQRGSAQTKEHTEAQQNTRVALDFITDYLRQAGSHTDYFRGQSAIVYAEPYQLVMNADIDNGRTIDGNAPLTAMDRASSPNRVTPNPIRMRLMTTPVTRFPVPRFQPYRYIIKKPNSIIMTETASAN